MIGQEKLKSAIKEWVQNDKFPRFIIIEGRKGSGKFTLSKLIAKQLSATFVDCELSVDSVRHTIQTAYKCATPTVYCFAGADSMSTAAKNALLKVTEEPPRRAYFILTVQNAANTLATLKSRAVTLTMEPYTKEELAMFCDERGIAADSALRELGEVPGIIVQLQNANVDEILQFCNAVIDNVETVSGVNAFKIVQRLQTKADGPGYSTDVFFHLMRVTLLHRAMQPDCAREDALKYARMLMCCSRWSNLLSINGLKKDAVLDMWVLDMRDC